jgi:hypothetical protein
LGLGRRRGKRNPKKKGKEKKDLGLSCFVLKDFCVGIPADPCTENAK